MKQIIIMVLLAVTAFTSNAQVTQETVNEIKKKAENGDAQSQRSMGILYLFGSEQLGVKRDLEKSKEWLIKAARQGNLDAKKDLNANFPEVDYNAEQPDYTNNEIALKYSVLDNDEGKSFLSVYHYAETGIEEGWAVIGLFLCNGNGVKKNVTEGIEFYKKAMNSNKECAQIFGKMFMANHLWSGVGVPKDQKQAALYYADCADYNSWYTSMYQNYYARAVATSYCRLGIAFEDGILGSKNIDFAIKMYSECVGNGVYDEITAFAIYKLGYYIEQGRYKAIRNRNGSYSPNIRLARSYYQDAQNKGDIRTKNLAKQRLQKIGF